MPQADQTFSRLNTDDADVTRPSSDFVAATNIVLEPGGIRPRRGNVVVPYALPATGVNKRLGGFTDGATGTVVSLLYNSLGAHRLIRFDPAANTETTLLEWSGLNLAADLLVQGGILDGLLVYLGADGYLRNVPLARVATGYYTPALLAAEPYALHLVKAPPTTDAPVAVREAGTGDTRDGLRIIEHNAYQFAVRWRYLDGETTPLSPFSAWVDVVENPATTGLRSISVALPPAPTGVSEVEVLVRRADILDWLVADTLRPASDGRVPRIFPFYGVVTGAALAASEATRSFESEWPGRAVAAGNSRLFKADLIIGYPTPEPAFTATVLSSPAATSSVSDLHDLPYLAKNNATRHRYYALASGLFPDPTSTYYVATPVSGSPGSWTLTAAAFSYEFAFEGPQPLENENPAKGPVEIITAQTILRLLSTVLTLHENSSYRVACQFYDAQGKPGGCSQARVVSVPAQNYTNLQQRSLVLALTATGADQQAEIPEWAHSYHFLVASNDRTAEFRQGQAADTRAFLGRERIVNVDGSVKEQPTLATRVTAHEKLWVDIGNWPAAGLGYVWSPGSGDLLRFLEDGQVFPITGQYGDYVEVQWSGAPAADRPRVEIYAPNQSAADTFYERGPRLAVVRGPQDTRRYSQTAVRLDGDCFLTKLSFPQLLFDATYAPPDKKKYAAAAVAVTVESMVPQYRLITGIIKTTTTQALTTFGNGKFGSFIQKGLDNAAKEQRDNVLDPQGITVGNAFAAQVAGPAAAVWLDMGYGGRPGLVVPLPLQRVRRKTLITFCGVKQQGNRINGLSQWDALNQYEGIPQEQGAVTRLLVADQAQSDGTVLLALQEFGPVSLQLGRGQLTTADGRELLTITRNVIGGSNTLRGGYGCVDPGTALVQAGKAFYLCRERAELLRYDRNGNVALGETYRCHTRLRQALAAHADSVAIGCYEPRRKEYWLTLLPRAANAQPLTLVFADRPGREGWVDACTSAHEAGLALGDELFTWKGGKLARHTPDAPIGTFFDVFAPSVVKFEPANPGARLTKTWKSIAVHSRARWLPTLLANADGQVSRVLPAWLKYAGGIWRAALRRDENTPGPGTPGRKLHGGRELQSVAIAVTLTAEADTDEVLTACGLGFTVATDQQPIS